MKRIIIVGSTGSGKTTLGNFLSQKLAIPCFDLDDLFWLPNWTPRPFEEFVSLVQEKAEKTFWIICGNQSKVREFFWPKADTIIWLDLPFYLLFYQLLKRSIQQAYSKQLICNGNQQTLKQFFWIVRWLFLSFEKRRKTYLSLNQSSKKTANWIHLKSRKEIKEFLKKF